MSQTETYDSVNWNKFSESPELVQSAVDSKAIALTALFLIPAEWLRQLENPTDSLGKALCAPRMPFYVWILFTALLLLPNSLSTETMPDSTYEVSQKDGEYICDMNFI